MRFSTTQIRSIALKPIEILIIDDHPHVCTGYSIFLSSASKKGEIPECNITVAYKSNEALHHFETDPTKYDLVLLDIRLPPFPERSIYSGEDLGLAFMKLNRNIKLIVLTSLADNHRLYTIFKILDPDALIVKSDLDQPILIQAVQHVMDGRTYYSSTFTQLLRMQMGAQHILSHEERKFLYLLNKGISSKNVPDQLYWSKSKFERRKRSLREKLGVTEKSVQALISAAKKAGFL